MTRCVIVVLLVVRCNRRLPVGGGKFVRREANLRHGIVRFKRGCTGEVCDCLAYFGLSPRCLQQSTPSIIQMGLPEIAPMI